MRNTHVQRLSVFIRPGRLQCSQPDAQGGEGDRHEDLKEDGHRVAGHIQSANFQQGSDRLAAILLFNRNVQTVQQLPSRSLVRLPSRSNQSNQYP